MPFDVKTQKKGSIVVQKK